jgi:hypothetical protein
MLALSLSMLLAAPPSTNADPVEACLAKDAEACAALAREDRLDELGRGKRVGGLFLAIPGLLGMALGAALLKKDSETGQGSNDLLLVPDSGAIGVGSLLMGVGMTMTGIALFASGHDDRRQGARLATSVTPQAWQVDGLWHGGVAVSGSF